MEKLIISYSTKLRKGSLDDDYTLYADGTVLHEYDVSTLSKGLNRERTLEAISLDGDIKERLLAAAKDDKKEIAKKLLGLT